MAMNAAGNGNSPIGASFSPAELRYGVIGEIINQYKPDIILIQEGRKKLYKFIYDILTNEHTLYECVYNDETAVSYNATKFKIFDPTQQLWSLNTTLICNCIISSNSQLLSRFKALVMYPKGPHVQNGFLVVSYHGRYNGITLENKKIFLKELLTLIMFYITTCSYLPVVIAGDFNMELDQRLLDTLTAGLSNPVFGHTILKLLSYTPTKNRCQIVDHMIVSSTLDVEDNGVIDVYKRITEMYPFVQQNHCPIILDHDPLFLSFSMQTPQNNLPSFPIALPPAMNQPLTYYPA